MLFPHYSERSASVCVRALGMCFPSEENSCWAVNCTSVVKGHSLSPVLVLSEWLSCQGDSRWIVSISSLHRKGCFRTVSQMCFADQKHQASPQNLLGMHILCHCRPTAWETLAWNIKICVLTNTSGPSVLTAPQGVSKEYSLQYLFWQRLHGC